MNDKMEVVMRLVAADWPNCSKGEILEHLPDMVEVADALLAAAGEQEPKPGHWHAVAMRQVDEIEALTARAEAAEAKLALTESILDDIKAQVARLERRLEPLTDGEAIRVLGCSAIQGMCGANVMKMVGFADIIRARRSE